MSDAKHKHLDFIQLAITRMGANSFLLKGWSVTLVAAVFALAHEDADQRYLFVAYLPNVIFYVLDSYYLYNERLFRKLYDAVAADDSSVPAFSMKLEPFEKGFPGKGWLLAMVSLSEGMFYWPLAIMIFVLSAMRG
jgi:hypothetical protein